MSHLALSGPIKNAEIIGEIEKINVMINYKLERRQRRKYRYLGFTSDREDSYFISYRKISITINHINFI